MEYFHRNWYPPQNDMIHSTRFVRSCTYRNPSVLEDEKGTRPMIRHVFSTGHRGGGRVWPPSAALPPLPRRLATLPRIIQDLTKTDMYATFRLRVKSGSSEIWQLDSFPNFAQIPTQSFEFSHRSAEAV